MKQFRGVSDLFFAEVTKDDGETYETGTPERLAYVARVGKDVTSDSASVFYDNKAMIVINSEGADEISIDSSVIELPALAKITGKVYNEELDMYVDSVRTVKYFALGYREKMVDGSFRYNWRLKGTFAIPAEEASTEDDGTDSNGQSLVYTGIFTETQFVNAGNNGAKGVVVSDEKADVSKWFDTVQTPDTVTVATV